MCSNKESCEYTIHAKIFTMVIKIWKELFQVFFLMTDYKIKTNIPIIKACLSLSITFDTFL